MYQSTGKEINSTIIVDDILSIHRDEEYIEELENPIRIIKNLKEDKGIIVTFNFILAFTLVSYK